jgi:hypothetical protein
LIDIKIPGEIVYILSRQPCNLLLQIDVFKHAILMVKISGPQHMGKIETPILKCSILDCETYNKIKKSAPIKDLEDLASEIPELLYFIFLGS